MESRGMNIIKSGDTSILFRAVLLDASGNPITGSPTAANLNIFHFTPSTGDIETFDFDDDTFKTTAVTTFNQATTHETADNGTVDTGIHQFRQTTLTDFDAEEKYVGRFTHPDLPAPVFVEFQYGGHEGDTPDDVADQVWDENIVSAHGTASAAGLLLRVLGAGISTRANNSNLNDLLGAADIAGRDVAGQVWEELAADHNAANTMGELQNAGGGAPTAAAIADAVWDELAAGHVGAGSFGLVLGSLDLTGRTFNSTLNDILGVPDSSGVNLVDAVWDENVVAAHGTASTSGLFLRALAQGIAERANNNTLNALLGVPDVATADIAFTVLDEVVDGANHNTTDTVGQRLAAIDTLIEAGGGGDLAAILTQANKLDNTALTTVSATSVSGKLDSLIASLALTDMRVVANLNLRGTDLHIEVGVEQNGIVETAPWVQADAQIFDESNAILHTIGIGDFGAIGARGFFQFTQSAHSLAAGQAYQMRVTISDGATQSITTTKPFKLIQTIP